MKKIHFSLMAAIVMVSNLVSAQAVDQGKKFLYYQRYKSAKETFEKVLASNPNDINAVYWLGQTLLQAPADLRDSVAAKALYQKALQTNGSAPLLLAGIGNIELREGKAADARQHFETAISLSKGKDVAVLNAIGLANADFDIKAGDPAYAIEKLNLATQVKGFNNPETYIILGDAYRKLIDGGNAVQSYEKALTLDPKYAAAKYKVGKVYLTQNNKEYFLPAFEEAVQLDPSYAPAYYELFYYWYYHSDVDKSSQYFDKYLAVTDPKPSDDYDKIGLLYAGKKYAECIAASQQKISSLGDKADPRYYKLIAYSYNDQGDSVNAKKYLDQYFTKQKPEGYVTQDYSFYAQVLSKFPGNDSLVSLNYQTAIDRDTLYENKLKFAKEASDVLKKSGNKAAAAKWQGVLYGLNKNPSNVDLYNWGIANYQAGLYKTSDSIFCGIYESKYPTEIFGYLWCAKSKLGEDTTMQSGIVAPAWEKLVEVYKATDSVKYKVNIVQTYFYLTQYYNDIKKDKDAAVATLRKILDIDPTNPDALKFYGILTAPPKKAAAKPKPAGK